MSLGEYSRLAVDFKFARKVGHYVFHFYIPTLVVTLFAYLCFWLSSKPASRLILSIVALFVIVSVVANCQLTTPSVSFLTPLDIYLGISVTLMLSFVLYHAFLTNDLPMDMKDEQSILQPYKQHIKIGLGITILLFNFCYWVIFTQAA